jgi:hypothetical protein
MSISFLNLGTSGIKELVKYYVREHASEIAIIGVTFAIAIGVAVLATGDLGEAIAIAKGRHR